MSEYDTALLQRQLLDLAEESRPPHGLAVAAVGRARRRRRLQVLAAATVTGVLVLGAGGLSSVLAGRPDPGPGGLSLTALPTGPPLTVTARPDSSGRVVGRMPRAVAVIAREGNAYGVDAAGRETLLARFPGADTADLRLSPDGTRLAVPGSALGDYRVVGLWLLDLPTGRADILTVGGDQLMSASWSPDGRSVLSERYGGGKLYVVPVGSGAVRTVRGFTGDITGWGPDGRVLAGTNAPVADGSVDRHLWLWLDPRTGRQERITGLDGWSGLGDQGGLPDPSATPDPSSTGPQPVLTGWSTGGTVSPDGTLLPFERPTFDGVTELTVVDLRTGRQVRTWRLPASDRSGQWTAWLDDGTLLAAVQPTGAPLTVVRLTVATGARSDWRSFTGASTITVARSLSR